MNGRTALLLAAALGLLVGAPGNAVSQESSWLPWIGCWEGAATIDAEDDSEAYLVCFRPSGDAGSVEILTYDEAGLVATEEMFADGAARSVEEGGCSGTRTARWAEHGTRVLLRSEMDCGDDVERATSGVLSILPDGEGWAEVQAVRVGTEDPLIGIRTFVPATPTILTERGIPDPAAGRELAIRSARTAAAGALTPEGLVEINEVAGPEVTSAFLVERGRPLGVDARTLEALASRGVPAEVLDVMVAMSFPERFEISGVTGGAEPEIRATDPRPERVADRGRVSRNAYGYSPWRFTYGAHWDPLWYDPFGYRGVLGYSPYCPGLRCYGYGYGGYGYGGYGSGYYGGPRVIVVEPPTVEDRPRLSRERGVIPPGGAQRQRDDSSVQTPSASGSGDRPSRPATRSPSPRSSGGDRPAAEPSSGGGSSSGGDVRRARPR